MHLIRIIVISSSSETRIQSPCLSLTSSSRNLQRCSRHSLSFSWRLQYTARPIGSEDYVSTSSDISCVLLVPIPTRAGKIVDQLIVCTGEATTPVHKSAGIAELQQLDRNDFQRVALHVSADIHAKVVFVVRCFESFHDLCISLCVELQEVLVLG